MFGLLFNQEALMNSSFLELLREEVGGYYTDLVQIDGGMDLLPRAFLPELRGRIRFGAQDGRHRPVRRRASPSTTRHAAGAFSADRRLRHRSPCPFPVLRHVEALKPFSRAKQRAIRQLHYDASAKILLQCRRRFWEEDDGIFGGGTVTDLPIRTVYYPDHGRETGRGVLLASYTWAEDAQRWGSLSPERPHRPGAGERGRDPPPDPATSSRSAPRRCGTTTSSPAAPSRCSTRASRRCCTTHIIAPEGRIHFAGEHASLAHAWIQGAIESGLRAAPEIHERAALGTVSG